MMNESLNLQLHKTYNFEGVPVQNAIDLCSLIQFLIFEDQKLLVKGEDFTLKKTEIQEAIISQCNNPQNLIESSLLFAANRENYSNDEFLQILESLQKEFASISAKGKDLK